MKADGSQSFATTEALLSAIVTSTDDAIYSKDRRAVIRSWNGGAQKMYGYSPEEAIGMDVGTLVPPQHKGEELEILARIIDGEKVDHYETSRLTKDGRLLKVSLTVSPLINEGGETVGASVIARDISDRSQAEILSRRVEKLEFVNLVAHELRNPLSALTGATDLLVSYADKLEPDLAAILHLILRQARNAEALIADLLDLSRIESGRFHVDMGEVDLARAATEALEASPTPKRSNVRIDIPDAVVVEADGVRLRQMLNNLLANAYKYGGDNVTIEAEAGPSEVVVAFCDDGPGLPEGYENQAFEVFVRVPGSKASGTGLGLAITKGLVEAQGGTIAYEPGEAGARFVIRLKRAGAEA